MSLWCACRFAKHILQLWRCVIDVVERLCCRCLAVFYMWCCFNYVSYCLVVAVRDIVLSLCSFCVLVVVFIS